MVDYRVVVEEEEEVDAAVKVEEEEEVDAVAKVEEEAVEDEGVQRRAESFSHDLFK